MLEEVRGLNWQAVESKVVGEACLQDESEEVVAMVVCL